jgi:chromosome segregation ATPase
MSDQVLSQILNQLQQMDKRFDHIDGRLEKIEDRLGTLDSRLDVMDGRLDTMDTRLDTMDTRLDAIEEQTKTIPLLQQAVLETLEVTKRLEASQITFERKVTAELNTHQHSIDILNRRQLRMEADIEALKHS